MQKWRDEQMGIGICRVNPGIMQEREGKNQNIPQNLMDQTVHAI